MKVIDRPLADLVPYANNPRKNDEAVKYVAESIKQFGFKVPLVIDKNGVIVAGHTRYKAAKKLGLTEVPCIIADDLTDEQVQAFRLADNKVSEIAEWDEELLKIELDDIVDIDMEAFGFTFGEEEQKESQYTTAINIPQYEITGDCPEIADLFDDEKTMELLAEIERSGVSEDQKEFLRKAARRHTAFNYSSIAEYYAHADEEMQRLMEKSALVIIDFQDAIRNGYVNLSAAILQMLEEDGGESNA